MGHRTENNKKKQILWAAALLVLLTLSVSGVRAYLLHSDQVSNTLTVDSHPIISIGKNHVVTVSDTAYPVYLRAAVVVNWKDADGKILATVPSGYTLTPGKDTKTGATWVKNNEDGFYYYTKSVLAGETIPPVITLTPPSVEQEGYTLVADVAVQAIQAIGTTDTDEKYAVENAWGIYVASDGTLTATPPPNP